MTEDIPEFKLTGNFKSANASFKIKYSKYSITVTCSFADVHWFTRLFCKVDGVTMERLCCSLSILMTFLDVGRQSIHLKNFGDRAKNLSSWSGKLSPKFHAIKIIRNPHELSPTLWATSMSADMSGRPTGPWIIYEPRRIKIE